MAILMAMWLSEGVFPASDLSRVVAFLRSNRGTFAITCSAQQSYWQKPRSRRRVGKIHIGMGQNEPPGDRRFVLVSIHQALFCIPFNMSAPFPVQQPLPPHQQRIHRWLSSSPCRHPGNEGLNMEAHISHNQHTGTWRVGNNPSHKSGADLRPFNSLHGSGL